MKPFNYVLNHHVTEKVLTDNGFTKKEDVYHCKKTLDNLIYVELTVDLKERWVTYFVKNKNFDDYYAQFYIPFEQDSSRYTQFIIKQFNKFMDRLCTYGILWRKGRGAKQFPNAKKKSSYINKKNNYKKPIRR